MTSRQSTRSTGGTPMNGKGAGGGLRARLDAATAVLADLVADLEPGCLSGPDAKELYGAFVAAERFCVAGKTLLAPRIDDTSVWAEDGHVSAASLLATLEGVPVGQARSTLELGHRLDRLPDTAEAIRQGKLSGPKAKEVVDAAILDPDTEGELLAGADELPHHQLRERCRRARATSANHDPVAATKRIYAERFFRSWSDPEGAFCYQGRDTADRGAQIRSHLTSVANGLRRQRRAERNRDEPRGHDRRPGGGTKAEGPGTVESEPALQADAFHALITRTGTGGSRAGGSRTGGTGKGRPGAGKTGPGGTGPRPGPDPDVDPDVDPDTWDVDVDGQSDGESDGDGDGDGEMAGIETVEDGFSLIDRPPTCSVNVRVDLAALLRGEAHPGEICEIDGHGPIPVKMARDMANDSFLRFIFCESGDIRSIFHFGRTINKTLRTALVHRDRTCVVPGCRATSRLEIDHVVPVTEGGPTTLDNLALLCHHHHFLKTFEGWTLEMVDGEDPEHPTWRFEPLPAFGEEPAVPTPDPDGPRAVQTGRRPTGRGDPGPERRRSPAGRNPDSGQLFEPG